MWGLFKKMRVREANSVNKLVLRLNTANLLRKPQFVTVPTPPKTFEKKELFSYNKVCKGNTEKGFSSHFGSLR